MNLEFCNQYFCRDVINIISEYVFIKSKDYIEKRSKNLTIQFFDNTTGSAQHPYTEYDYKVLYVSVNFKKYLDMDQRLKKYLTFNYDKKKAYVFVKKCRYSILKEIIQKHGFKKERILWEEDTESDILMNFGKYKGMKITDIAHKDSNYLMWIKNNQYKYLNEERKALVDDLTN